MARTMDDRTLELVLADVGARLDHPAPTGMAGAVRARIAQRRSRARPRFALLPALVTASIVLLVVALGVPQVRAAAVEVLRLGGIEIFRGPVPAQTPRPSTSASPALAPGSQRVTLDQARRRVAFPVLVPADPRLGAPDEVLVEAGGSVTLVYAARPGVPAGPSGISALVIELPGTVEAQYFAKAAGPGTTVEEVSVDGQRGYWLSGAPHLFFYRAADGSVRQETLRLAGNTLLWERGGVILRLEAAVDRETALALASSFR